MALEELGGKKTTIGTSHQKEIYILCQACQHQKSGLMRLMFQGRVLARGRGHQQTNYISNMTSWLGYNSKQLFKLAQDRER